MILWISPDICLVYTLVYREMMIVNYARKVMACRRKFNITALFVMCNYGECMLFPPHFVLIAIPTWELRTDWLRPDTELEGWDGQSATLQEYFMLLCGVLPPLSSRSSQTKIGLLFCLSMRRRFCLRKCLKLNRRELLSGETQISRWSCLVWMRLYVSGLKWWIITLSYGSSVDVLSRLFVIIEETKILFGFMWIVLLITAQVFTTNERWN